MFRWSKIPFYKKVARLQVVILICETVKFYTSWQTILPSNVDFGLTDCCHSFMKGQTISSFPDFAELKIRRSVAL